MKFIWWTFPCRNGNSWVPFYAWVMWMSSRIHSFTHSLIFSSSTWSTQGIGCEKPFEFEPHLSKIHLEKLRLCSSVITISLRSPELKLAGYSFPGMFSVLNRNRNITHSGCKLALSLTQASAKNAQYFSKLSWGVVIEGRFVYWDISPVSGKLGVTNTKLFKCSNVG